MARPRNSIPSYLHHQATGRGRTVWTDPAGIRRERLLPGLYNSKESKAAHAKLLLELPRHLTRWAILKPSPSPNCCWHTSGTLSATTATQTANPPAKSTR